MNVVALRAALVVAAVYGYFLIFAQFAFIELLRAGGMGLDLEKAALAVMAVAGIGGGFLVAWHGASVRVFRIALALAALTAAVAPWAGKMPIAMGVALATGLSIGVATVTLSALIPAWCGVVWVGLGTGLGYACCNLPLVFKQTPVGQTWIAVGFGLLGMLVVPAQREWLPTANRKVFPLWAAVAVFTALVWLDSAAFFIIQHTAALKSGTWGDGMLWRNAAIHLLLAVVAGLWLERRGARWLPGAAWLLIGVAALAVNAASLRGFAGWLYPAGVSLYSSALIAWPAWFAGAENPRSAAWKAAWLFAIAGWIGSANGIGMAQTLQHVPLGFVIATGGVVLGVIVMPKRLSVRTDS